MNRHLHLAALAALLVLGAPACIDDTCEFPFSVVMSVNEGAIAPPGTKPVTFSGRLDSSGRIDLLTVAGQPVEGRRDNYGLWQITLPNAVLQQQRVGNQADLAVVATDFCGGVHEGPVVAVPLSASDGSPAPGLAVSLAATRQGECFIPAAGTHTGTVVVTADIEAAGVPVKLVAPTGTHLLGVSAETPLVLSPTEGGASATAELRASGASTAGLVTVSASAGPTASLSESLIVAGPPTLSPATTSTLTAGVPTTVTVATEGRLDACEAIASAPASTTVAFASKPDVNLLGGSFLGPDGSLGTCGQLLVLHVTVAPTAPQGATVTLTCADTYGQKAATQFALAATGTSLPASGLTVTLEPADAEACSLPADGSALGRVRVRADLSAAGVPVKLSPSKNVELLGVTDNTVTLQAGPDGAEVTAFVRWSGAAPGAATVSAVAGPDFSLSAPLSAVAPPSMAALAPVQRGTSVVMSLATDGQMAVCEAFATAPEHTSAVIVGGTDLLAGKTTFPLTGCGQSLAIEVGFGLNAPSNAALTITCEDLHGQTVSKQVVAAPSVGGDVAGLAVTLVPINAGECFIPADGLGLARAAITAEAAEVGAPVTLTMDGATLLGGGSPTQLTLTDGATEAVADAYVQANTGSDGLAVATVSAGTTFAQSAPLVVAAKPSADVDSGSLQPGQTQLLTFSTAGRFDVCSAYATVPSKATVTQPGSPTSDLLVSPLELDDATCGQKVTLQVSIAADAEPGTTVYVSCDDAYGQGVERVFTAAVP